MSTENILTRTEDAVRTITFHRPQKKNALSIAMYEGFVQALLDAERDPEVHVILVTGSGDVFTAGNDLGDFLANPPTSEDSAVIRMLHLLVDLTKPLVAAVDGPAIGIGTTLLLHADYVVASSRARFQLPFVVLGLSPEGGSTVLLPRRVGAARAAEWLLFGEPFDAAHAHAAGFINHVVAPEELHAFALARAKALAAKPFGSVLASKRLVREPQRAELHDAILREGVEFLQRVQSPEAAEAFQAFFRKRA